ncbi:OmpA family protein [Pedobacter sp. HMF7647]|uniref:OmpA family protein n=1 Tax=Hufsiella arboris TaxID=2695275 RepID=A0A7K1YC90_9SPHI|nr:OmpA family protein [Hufsiella arboris]MXV52185.1 OmpA family protein [Hufsiella arboris]
MKNRYLLAFILLIGSLRVLAQEQLSYIQKADQYYKEYQYSKASPIYLRYAESSKKVRIKVLEKLADCYRKMNQYEKAEEWYGKLTENSKSDVRNLVLYGQVLKANGHYKEAKTAFQQYLAKTGDTKNVIADMAGCDSALVWLDNPTPVFKLRNEDAINTKLSEFSVFPVGDKIYYTGEPDSASSNLEYGWTGKSYLKIFTAKRADNNILSEPMMVGPEINNLDKYHIGPISSNRSGDKWFITRSSGNDGLTTKESGQKYRTHNLGLFIYTKTDGKWQEPKAFKYNNVKKYSIGHASLSADEKVLYFVSNMPGGYGGTDIWFSQLQDDGSWGKPQNAGAQINSNGDEKFPEMAADGTLYFSSDGLPGMGGLDVFSAKGSTDKWTKPVNMQYPVNSPGDDFAFITVNGQDNGFVSSNRSGGMGGDDIYSFQKIDYTPVVIALEGHVYNKKTGEPLLNSLVNLSDKVTSKTDENGYFRFDLDKNSNYTVSGSAKGFYADSANLNTQGINKSKVMNVDLKLEPLELAVGKKINLKNIYYDFDKTVIRHDAAKVLDELVQIMKENPTLKIELASHTDSRGVDIYNLDLSQRRAKSAVNYIISKGISSDRLKAKGYGETKLLNRCANGVKCTKADHQLNRRTEFTILEY